MSLKQGLAPSEAICCDTEVYNGMKTSLKCRCGQHLTRRDVMQLRAMRYGKTNYVFLKFRCSHCKKLGELYVKPEEWSEALFQEGKGEFTIAETKQFSKLGAITFDEMKRFHMELEKLSVLPVGEAEE